LEAVRVNVTQECIDSAIQQDRHNCAVVIAVKYANNDFERIEADQDQIVLSIRSEQLRYWWKTPATVRKHIDQYDLDKAGLKPFMFTLDPEKATKVKPVKQQSATGLIKRASRPGRSGVKKSTAHRPLPKVAA